MMKQETVVARLTDAGVPPAQAEAKAEVSVIGWALTVFGFFALVVASVLAVLALTNQIEVGAFLVILVGAFIGLAFALVGFGMHLLAREGAPSAVKGIADAIVAIIRAIRGQGGAP